MSDNKYLQNIELKTVKLDDETEKGEAMQRSLSKVTALPLTYSMLVVAFNPLLVVTMMLLTIAYASGMKRFLKSIMSGKNDATKKKHAKLAFASTSAVASISMFLCFALVIGSGSSVGFALVLALILSILPVVSSAEYASTGHKEFESIKVFPELENGEQATLSL